MDEITDSTGKKVPASQVKCVQIAIHGKAINSKLFGTDPDDSYHFGFQTIDGEQHSSQDYPDQATAYEKMAALKTRVEQLTKQ